MTEEHLEARGTGEGSEVDKRLVLLIFVDADTSFWYLVAPLAALGLGFGLFSSPKMLSIGLATLIFAVIIGNVQITPEVHSEFVSSVQIAFAIFSVLCVAGLFASRAPGACPRCGETMGR